MRSVSPVVFVSLLGLAACAPAGSSAFVSANAVLTGDCTASDTLYQSVGLYDVLSKDGAAKMKNCIRPYQLSLVVNSNLIANGNVSLGRAEPNTLVITHADVTLLDTDEAPFAFLKDGSPDTSRPNPFRVRTAVSIPPSQSDDPSQATVMFEAIPSRYGEKLRSYAERGILLEVQLYGTTTGNIDVDFPPFVYPLALCSDCLSTCKLAKQWLESPGDLAELNAGECEDGRPQDGRYCVDPDC